jgi:pheromone a factor receptor
VFVWVPPLIIGLISGIYCGESKSRTCHLRGILLSFVGITIHSFNKRRTQFKARLSGHNLNSNRYFRLMGLASLDLCCTVPIASYFIWTATTNGVAPWISWADTHSNFGEVDQIPALIWKSNALLAHNLQLSRGLCIACAFVFFGFFGFAEEARKNYHSAYTSVAKRVGYSTGSMSSGATSTVGYVFFPLLCPDHFSHNFTFQ